MEINEKIKLMSDKTLKRSVELISKKFDAAVEADDLETAEAAESLMMDLLKEQRERDESYSKQDIELGKLELEKKKSWIEIAKVITGAFATGGVIFSAWAGLEGKKIEMQAKTECWKEACGVDKSGELILRQPGNLINMK